jgi:hypothetical protein
LTTDENTIKFHKRASKHGHGHGHGDGHSHQHGHSHAEGHSHGRGHGHGHQSDMLDAVNREGVEETIPYMGGFSTDFLEKTFNSTGLLENVTAKVAFSTDLEGIYVSFVLASGRKA